MPLEIHTPSVSYQRYGPIETTRDEFNHKLNEHGVKSEYRDILIKVATDSIASATSYQYFVLKSPNAAEMTFFVMNTQKTGLNSFAVVFECFTASTTFKAQRKEHHVVKKKIAGGLKKKRHEWDEFHDRGISADEANQIENKLLNHLVNHPKMIENQYTNKVQSARAIEL